MNARGESSWDKKIYTPPPQLPPQPVLPTFFESESSIP